MPVRHAAHRRPGPGPAATEAPARLLVGALVLAVLGVSCLVALLALGLLPMPGSTTPGSTTPGPSASGASRAAGTAVVAADDDVGAGGSEDAVLAEVEDAERVLRSWDRRRALAWRRADPEALRDLYVAGSRAGRRDVALLERWNAQGLRVEEMAMRLEQVWVLSATPTELRLVVRDRLGAVRATPFVATSTTPSSVRLPPDDATVRLMVLRRDPTGWQMARVRLR